MENKVCKECNIEKSLDRFKPEKRGKYRSHQCKDCRNKHLRTGKENTGRYKKGHVSKNGFKKGQIPWNKDVCNGKSRSSKNYKIWQIAVRERDQHKCVKCGKETNLATHHIKPWKEYPNLRFDIDNGLTLCYVCHGKEEGPLNEDNGIFTRFKKGHKLSKESIEKMKQTKTENRIKNGRNTSK